jgi:hypothetical protein
VFHIPVEERRGQLAAGGFGADDSMKIIKSVMEKTSAKIEMSSNKDQSLTFLISGRQDSVLRARRELLAQFQVPLAKPRFCAAREGGRFFIFTFQRFRSK